LANSLEAARAGDSSANRTYLSNFLRYYLPLAVWMGLILLFSTSEFGAGLTYRWVRAVARFFDPEVTERTVRALNIAVRKFAHVTEYFILAVLVWRALRRGAAEAWRARWLVTTVSVCLVFAVADELHQSFEPGRGASIYDVGWDALGLALALAWLYLRARREPGFKSE
jgi:VanZ family protein